MTPAMRALGRFSFAFAVLTVVGAGCSAIVSGDVPQYTCVVGVDNACPPGQTCNNGLCSVATDATTTEDTSTEETSTTEGGTDTGKPDGDAGPLALGTACRVNGDCASKLCGTSTVLTNAITGGPGPICTTPCCRSFDCPTNFVCINPGSGGSYCVPATLASRTPAAAGGKVGGATCTQDNECRSGKCEKEDGGATSRCLDTCCGDGECTGTGVVCRLRRVPMPTLATLHYAWVCADQAGTFNAGTACTTQDQCKSEACIPVGSGTCRPTCSNTASCRALGGIFSPNGRCVYGVDTSDYFRFCQQNAGGATLTKGQACTSPGECISGYCDDETDKCLEVCARDADCLSSETCKPSGVTTPFLRCVPK